MCMSTLLRRGRETRAPSRRDAAMPAARPRPRPRGQGRAEAMAGRGRASDAVANGAQLRARSRTHATDAAPERSNVPSSTSLSATPGHI